MRKLIVLTWVLFCPLAMAQHTGSWELNSTDTASNGKVFTSKPLLKCSADGTGTIDYQEGYGAGPALCFSSGNELEVKNWGNQNPKWMNENNKPPTFHAVFTIDGDKIEGKSLLPKRREIFTDGNKVD